MLLCFKFSPLLSEGSLKKNPKVKTIESNMIYERSTIQKVSLVESYLPAAKKVAKIDVVLASASPLRI